MTTAKQKSAIASEPYFRFTPREKQQFLTIFIENMTIAVRDAYLLDAAAQAARLKSWNELLHRVAGNLRALLQETTDCFPDDVLFDMIYSAARDEALHSQVEWALDDSYKYVQSKKKAAPKIAPAH